MREGIRAGLERVEALKPGQGFAEATAGVRGDWSGGLVAFARGEVGFKPTSATALFGFAEATAGGATPGWMAGVGARVTW